MPVYENGFLWLVWCNRCETQQEQWRSDDGDRFRARCECCDFEISGLTQSLNGPTTGSVIYRHKLKGIRPSRRLLAVGPHGRLFRELWRSPEGAIVQSGADFVVLPNGEGKQQFWTRSFPEAYCELTSRPWPEEGGAE
jgi:hypothetical protein